MKSYCCFIALLLLGVILPSDAAPTAPDTIVQLNIEAVPFSNLKTRSGVALKKAEDIVFNGGKKVENLGGRDRHWQLVERDVSTGTPLSVIGFGADGNNPTVQYATVDGILNGAAYPDWRLDSSTPPINPKTGEPFEPRIMTHQQALGILEDFKSKASMTTYAAFNNTDLAGAIDGSPGFFQGKHIVDNAAMMEWVGKNCQLLAMESYFSEMENYPTKLEWNQQIGGSLRTEAGLVNLNNVRDDSPRIEKTSTGLLNKDVLDSLMKFGETLEEGFEVREDMREDRRERKEREQARREQEERERQAALEAERRKQAQRQKKNDEKREKAQAKTTPAKTTPTTQQKTTAATTATVDFSRLNSLISQQVSFVRGILSSGEKATSAQHAQFNSLNNQYVSEFNRLKAQIATISDPTKKSQYYSQLASINSRISSELDPLLAQGQSRGLFVNF